MKKIFFAAVFTVFAAAVCFSSGDAESYDAMVESQISKTVPLISTEELQTLINDGTEIFILDTREPEEYEVSRIINSINTGFDNFSPRDIDYIPESAAIIVYCSVGVRSGEIGDLLIGEHYKNVHNLYGGIFKWFNEEKPVYNTNGATDRIHGYSEKWARWLNRGTIEY